MSLFCREGHIRTSSRGGGDYNDSTEHIRNSPEVINFFKKNPDIILDGELYVHGRSLQWISGTARLEKFEERCLELQFWCYDIYLDTKPFSERVKILEKYQEEIGESEHVKFVEHILLSGYSKIKKQHDKWVSEGYEGLVMRNPDKCYIPGNRSNAWIKLKEYQDDEFEIVGYSDGLRDEDMVFVCKTKKGKEFEAKPMGSRELKYEYLENMDDIIGKMATVKFFNWTDDEVPSQPVLKSIRGYGE